MVGQFDLFGDEATPEEMERASTALSPTQHAIVLHIREYGSIRSITAGVIVHGGRGCEHGKADHHGRYVGAGCCRYASSDGTAVMTRMLERGFVKRTARGLWVLA